jgi:hypothetical protein
VVVEPCVVTRPRDFFRGHKRIAAFCSLSSFLVLCRLWPSAQCDISQSSRDQVLEYTFEPAVDGGGLVIHVRLDFAAKDKRSAELELPSDWAGQSHLETRIRNLKTLSANRVLLDTPYSNIKTRRFPTDSHVAVSCDLVKDWNGPLEYPKL